VAISPTCIPAEEQSITAMRLLANFADLIGVEMAAKIS